MANSFIHALYTQSYYVRKVTGELYSVFINNRCVSKTTSDPGGRGEILGRMLHMIVNYKKFLFQPLKTHQSYVADQYREYPPP